MEQAAFWFANDDHVTCVVHGPLQENSSSADYDTLFFNVNAMLMCSLDMISMKPKLNLVVICRPLKSRSELPRLYSDIKFARNCMSTAKVTEVVFSS